MNETTGTEAFEMMKTFRFGVEIETVGRSRMVLAGAIQMALQVVTGGVCTVKHLGGYYDKVSVRMPDGRDWILMSDASLSSSTSAEVVSPILTYADMDMLQAVVRAVKAAGAKVDTSCGIHVHVDGASFDGAGLVRLAKYVYSQERLLVAALGVTAGRMNSYTREVDADFIARIESSSPRTVDQVNAAWYGMTDEARKLAAGTHYHSSRYHGLNLHSMFFRGTIEFRYFESTLHAGKVKAYVQLCLALAAKAKLSRSSMARKREFNAATAKYDFRVVLLRLGMIGDEFKTARLHLLERFEGDAAFKNGRPVATPPAVSSAAPASEEAASAVA